MTTPNVSPPRKATVLIAALTLTCWLVFFVSIPIIVTGLVIALFAGMPSVVTLPPGMSMTILSFLLLLLLCGAVNATIALINRCPHCRRKFLINGAMSGDPAFQDHPNCPKPRFGSPLAYQLWRFVRTRQMRCIHCGDEIFTGET